MTITIPAGALDGDVTIAATRLGAVAIGALPQATAAGIDGVATLSDAVFAFTPHGTTFAQAVTVAIDHGGTEKVVLRLDDENDATWEYLEDTTTADGVTTFEVGRFSVYAVAAALRECQRAACDALAVAIECGLVDDGCGSQVDVQLDCGRIACDGGKTCNSENRCVADGCESTFSCDTTTAECGVEVDNCGTSHDVVAECADINGCGALGSCTNINLCGACTPYATCAEALAAAGDDCGAAVADGCGSTMDCGDVCEPLEGKDQACFFIIDEYSAGGGYNACKIPCFDVGDCPVFVSSCYDGDTIMVGGRWCEAETYCNGIVGLSDCYTSGGLPSACVEDSPGAHCVE